MGGDTRNPLRVGPTNKLLAEKLAGPSYEGMLKVYVDHVRPTLGNGGVKGAWTLDGLWEGFGEWVNQALAAPSPSPG